MSSRKRELLAILGSLIEPCATEYRDSLRSIIDSGMVDPEAGIDGLYHAADARFPSKEETLADYRDLMDQCSKEFRHLGDDDGEILDHIEYGEADVPDTLEALEQAQAELPRRSLSPHMTLREVCDQSDQLLESYEDCPAEAMAKWNTQRDTLTATGQLDLPIRLEELFEKHPEASQQYDLMSHGFDELVLQEEHDRQEKIQKIERKIRHKADLREKISLRFPTLVEDRDIPHDLLLCIKCRESGHCLDDCSQLPDLEPPGPSKEDFVRSAEGLNPPLREPKRISLRPRAGMDPLIPCGRCDSLPIAKVLQYNEGCPSVTVDLGWVSSFQFRNDCPMCVGLLNTLPDNVISKHGYLILASDLSQGRQLRGILATTAAEKDLRSLQLLVNNYPQVSHNDFVFYSLGRGGEAPSALHQVNGDNSNLLRAPFRGKVNDAELDVGQIHMWINRCCKHHSGTCALQTSPQLHLIRLIDTYRRKLVLYSETHSSDYIALSYVWGSGYRATFPGERSIGPLPRTLEDGISLVRKLGKRYLWVDSICINQADEADKQEQIALMDSIYSGAWLTIVAISASSADIGMSRIRNSSTTQDQFMWRGQHFVSSGRTLGQQVSRSRWCSRAWTFQEALLSPRCLYLADEQAYFECNSSISSESLDDFDSIFHTQDNTVFMKSLRSGEGLFRNPFARRRRPDDIFGKALDVDGSLQYDRLLKQYSRREMTDDGDSINAFGGILKQLTDRYFPEGFFQGIPVEDLPACLLWEHLQPPEGRQGFPAWSWAGWKGELHVTRASEAHAGGRSDDSKQPYFQAFKVTDGQIQQIHLSVPSRAPIPWRRSRSSQSGWPYDPLWDLAQVMPASQDFGVDLLTDAECNNYLILDCITLKLTLDATEVSHVMLDGVECMLKWYSTSTAESVTQRLGQEQVFIVLQRTLNRLELLMIEEMDLGAYTAALRTAAVTLHLTNKQVFERMKNSDGPFSRPSAYMSQASEYVNGVNSVLNNVVEYMREHGQDANSFIEGMEKFGDFKAQQRDEFACEEFYGGLLARAASPQRRQLVLV